MKRTPTLCPHCGDSGFEHIYCERRAMVRAVMVDGWVPLLGAGRTRYLNHGGPGVRRYATTAESLAALDSPSPTPARPTMTLLGIVFGRREVVETLFTSIRPPVHPRDWRTPYQHPRERSTPGERLLATAAFGTALVVKLGWREAIRATYASCWREQYDTTGAEHYTWADFSYGACDVVDLDFVRTRAVRAWYRANRWL